MTLIFNCNNSSGSFENTWFQWKEFMKTSSPSGPGWNVIMSGTGSSGSYGNEDLLTSSNMLDNYAWFVIQDPSGNRELLFSFYNNTITIFYSKQDGFTGGDEDSYPSANDGVNIYYNGTSPGSRDYFFGINLPNYLHMWADDSGEYSFGMFALTQGSNGTASKFFMEEVINGDTLDPVVFYMNPYNDWTYGNFANEANVGSGNSGGFRSISFYGTDYEFWSGCPAACYCYNNDTGNILLPINAGRNQWRDGKFQLFPITVMLRANVKSRRPILKGTLKYMKWAGLTLTRGEAASMNSERDYLIMEDIAIPWDGSIPLR